MGMPPNIDELRRLAEGGDARAQYMLAASLSASGEGDEAEKWLTAAFRNGAADAGYTLATRKFHNRSSAAETVSILEDAATKGSAPAKRLLGVFYAAGLSLEVDWAHAISLVTDAASTGDPAAQREIAMLLLSADASDPLGLSLLEGVAEMDAVAAAVYIRIASTSAELTDHNKARGLLQKLSAARYPNANALSIALNASGNAGPTSKNTITPSGNINWADIEDRLNNAAARPLPEAVVECEQPAARSWRGAFSLEECEYVIATAARHLGPSLVVDPRTGETRQDAYRTSLTAILGTVDLDLALMGFNRRLAKLAERSLDNGEFLSVLNYAPGQEYKPHYDWLPPGEDLDRGGQRVTTALLYLNDDYEGGDTHFVTPDVRFKGAAGDVLVFHNAFPDGSPDKSSRHASLPVTNGVKWIASKWFREKQYNF